MCAFLSAYSFSGEVVGVTSWGERVGERLGLSQALSCAPAGAGECPRDEVVGSRGEGDGTGSMGKATRGRIPVTYPGFRGDDQPTRGRTLAELASTYLKICLMGGFAVGKSSLARRFASSVFDDTYVSTVGVRVIPKAVDVPGAGGSGKLTIMLWDLVGCEELQRGQESYLHGVAGAVLVCDLTRLETLATLRDCVDAVLRVSPEVQLVLAANKCDMVDLSQFDLSRVEALAADLDVPYYLTSARTGEGVDTLFRHLIRLVVTSPREPSARTPTGTSEFRGDG